MHAPPSFTPSSLSSITCGLSIPQTAGPKPDACVACTPHTHTRTARPGAVLGHGRGPRLLAAAPRPAHWPLGGERGGSCVRHALHARLPLGLHLALDLSPIDLPGAFRPAARRSRRGSAARAAGRGRLPFFRPFPNDLRARSRIFQTPKDFTFFSFWINYGSKIFWSRTVVGVLGTPPSPFPIPITDP